MHLDTEQPLFVMRWRVVSEKRGYS